ncbi:MAG: ABC transporter permease [Micrococcales bacterium]|nr:ABC transporter permease [Micrococcales bacterium]MCL2669027.1 ABC transporter permease [Micrococcales bacterium]
MILKEFHELRRDRRTVAMLVVMPVAMLVIFGYAANFKVDHLSTAIVGPYAKIAEAQLPQLLEGGLADSGLVEAGLVNPDLFDVVRVDPHGDAKNLVRDNVADVVIDTSTNPPTVYLDGSALFVAMAASAELGRMGDKVNVEVLYNPDLKTAWVMVPALIGLVLAFVGTIVTSIGLVRERAAGTLEQLAVMPLRPIDVIIGKIAPYFVLAALDMVIITVLGVVIFKVPFNGNVGVFALGALLFLFVVLGLGVLISTVSQTQAQAIQGAIMVTVPQVLLSGFIFPLTSMAVGIRWIGYCLPLTYFVQISQGVMLRGAPMSSLWLPFTVLAGMAVFIVAVSVLRFRRTLAGGGS